MNNALIYGKNNIQNVVGLETSNNKLFIYLAKGDKTETIRLPNYHYILMDKYDIGSNPGRLEGNNHYKYFKKFTDKSEIYEFKEQMKYKGIDCWYPPNPVESVMLKDGYTQYKGMKLNQISCLSFDIETTGVKIDDNSFVLLISNTYRDRSGNVIRKLFSFDEYDKPKDFLNAWCKWVREVNPDVVLGHNIFNFDFPYLIQCAKNWKTKLYLGRDASTLKVDRRPGRFRKDGSQTYEFYNCRIFGREIVDTFFLSIKYDIGRKYPNYKLKDIIKFEKMDKEDRQYWDFDKHKEPWSHPEQWVKFKKYAEEDADDALKLFDLMAPQYFYYTQSIPKTFQQIINSATGSQVDYFMIRSYLQYSKAIPKTSEKTSFEGGISIGNPGIYHNVFKVDVASLYPSIILQYNVYNPEKDPERNLIAALEYFTSQRLEDKRLANETGDRYYTDMSNGRKIFINSMYGFMGAPGLRFNYPEGAAKVTRVGREVLEKSMKWANHKGFTLVNADTDSISFVPNGNITINDCLTELNSLFPEKIHFENDGVYDSVIVVKAKNYLLKKGDEVTIKGSALKASMKETALRDFLQEALSFLMDKDIEGLHESYMDYVDQIKYLKDITPWCSKKTITEALLTNERSNEAKVRDALGDKHVQEGDKIHTFFLPGGAVCLRENFTGLYDADSLYSKLFKTVSILSPILLAEMGTTTTKMKNGKEKIVENWKLKFKNYALKSNKVELERL